MKESFINLFSGYEHFIGGFAGGFASTIFCHPFDLLKVRFSANDGSSVRPQYKSYWQAARIIHAANGIPGLYRGITPTLIAAPLSWGLYFQLYDQIRSSTNTSPNFPIVDNLLAGTITGAVVLSITNPFWVCKTRMCLQYENRGPAELRYTGLVDCWMKIWHKERWRGLYSGFVPGLFGTVNGAVQFAIYNWLKDWRCRKLGIEQYSQLQPQDYLVFSTLSKCMSTIITFPYQLVRTRLQDPHTKYAGTMDCIKRTWQREGPFGLYKGVLAATVKQLPYSIITYVVYEQTRYFFERHNKGME